MKNILKLRLSTVVLFAAILLVSSCLKDNEFFVDFSDYEPNIELPLAAVNVNGPALALFDDSAEPTEYYAFVNVASMDKPTSPVTATLALDVDYLNQYNADQAAANENYVPFELLPDSAYSISSWDITVAPGEREGKLPIEIVTRKIDLSKKYILPLTIAQSSMKISNWNHLMINVSAKNQWDGKYLYNSVTSLGDAVDESAKMATVGQYSVTMNLVNGYSNQVVFTVDPLTNKVTVSMTTLLPIETDPISNWDPATKTFYVKWTSNGGGRHFEEWYVKQ